MKNVKLTDAEIAKAKADAELMGVDPAKVIADRLAKKAAALQSETEGEVTSFRTVIVKKEIASGGAAPAAGKPHRFFHHKHNPNAPHFDVATVKKNEEKHGIEIYFPGKPSDEILGELKSAKWRWGAWNGCWYNKDCEETEQFAAIISDWANSEAEESAGAAAAM